MGKSIDNLITSLVSHKNADNAHHMAGTVVRQYSYTAPQAVIQFVKKYRNGLSSLSVREALKALHRNGYI